ncbi:MAG: PBSX family phage terminase large subunit, partial [Cetobacterium sp.]
SYNMAIKLVLKLLQEKRKALVVREVYATLKESCFSLIIEVLDKLGADEFYKYTTTPLKITFINGSEIIFRGADKPEKLKSINGVSLVWLEESFEIKYSAFKEILGRLRTPVSTHILLSMNPVSKTSWGYKHFITDKKIDEEDFYNQRIIKTEDTYYHHSIVTDNSFVSEDYIKQLDDIKTYDADLYRIARLGRFGSIGTKVLTNVHLDECKVVKKKVDGIGTKFMVDGMDFGFSVSYNAFVRCAIDIENNFLYVYDMFYNKGLINNELTQVVKDKVLGSYHNIIADSSRPELIEEIKRSGIRIKKTKKGPGSVKEGIQKLRSFNKIIIGDNLLELHKEIKDLTFKTDKDGIVREDEFSWDCHYFDAMFYAIEDYRFAQRKHGKIERGGL